MQGREAEHETGRQGDVRAITWERGQAMSDTATDDLPPPDTRRWVSSRKAKVVEAVRTGLVAPDH